ncbi:hypothetical protein AVEN_116504-1 [Araneus ventricosus]|uniref:Uncharacterized protein n=1 Tax=Araneus ventricosus TaxID=182803 RepID=A0A4Y2PCV3_ARAVE|nr:hypothetical protein AVEN_116504-1 [Araneus ventricosus]
MTAEAANLQFNGGASTSTDSFTMSLGLPLPNYSVQCLRKRIWEEIDEHWAKHFAKHFTENEFGHVCRICDRLWFLKDVTSASKNERFLSALRAEFPDKDVQTKEIANNKETSRNKRVTRVK